MARTREITINCPECGHEIDVTDLARGFGKRGGIGPELVKLLKGSPVAMKVSDLAAKFPHIAVSGVKSELQRLKRAGLITRSTHGHWSA